MRRALSLPQVATGHEAGGEGSSWSGGQPRQSPPRIALPTVAPVPPWTSSLHLASVRSGDTVAERHSPCPPMVQSSGSAWLEGGSQGGLSPGAQ